MDARYNQNFLFFDEGPHKYTDTFGNEYRSVTTLIGDYYPPFNTEYWAHKKAREQGKSEKTIKAEWDRIKNEACYRGTKTHNGLEDAIKETSKFKKAIKYLTDTNSGRVITIADIPSLIPQPLDIEKFKEATENKYPEIYRVFDYYIKKGYVIYSEIGAFLMDYLISGTIDIFCYRPTDFVILDWKTNRDGLKFEAGYYKKDKTTIPNQLTDQWIKKREMMLPPLSHVENCNGEHYTMQLSLYALMAELILGIPCTGLGLCHIGSPWIKNAYGQPLRDSQGYHVDPNGEETINWFRIQYRKNEAINLLKDRMVKLKANKKHSNQQLTLF
jgi:hypothetical protein